MLIRTLRQDPAALTADWLVVGLHEGESALPDDWTAAPLADLLTGLLATGELPGTLGETLPVLGATGLGARGLMVVGLGPRAKFQAGAAFASGVAISRKLGSKPRDSVAVLVPSAVNSTALVSALVEGLIVGTKGVDLRKSEPTRYEFQQLLLVEAPTGPLGAETLERGARRGEIVGQAVNLARLLANTPASEKPPTRLAQQAREIAEQAGLGVQVHEEAWLKAERFGGVLAVAAGSDQPPAFVELDHRHGGDRPTIALVGKGVTFDSGGLSLKPSASMEDMKCDMTGAAVVLATMQAVARLALPINLVGYFALAENMTGGRAMKLGDVLTHRNGKTVEVMNTDAEGRLVLADVLSYAVEQGPERILDLATLTGACLVALGPKIAGLFSNDEAFAAEIQQASQATGERVWRLPLDEDFRDQLKSPIADLKNVGGKWGGAITAAKFLEQFVGTIRWAHLDIAGPSWAESDAATRDSGATGCFVRTLVGLLEATATPCP